MNNRINTRILSLLLALFCILTVVSIPCSESRAKNKEPKTITIEKGKTYKLKCGKWLYI